MPGAVLSAKDAVVSLEALTELVTLYRKANRQARELFDCHGERCYRGSVDVSGKTFT